VQSQKVCKISLEGYHNSLSKW